MYERECPPAENPVFFFPFLFLSSRSEKNRIRGEETSNQNSVLETTFNLFSFHSYVTCFPIFVVVVVFFSNKDLLPYGKKKRKRTQNDKRKKSTAFFAAGSCAKAN